MELFKEYCLRVREGVENRNVDMLIDCILQYDAEKEEFTYKDVKINLQPFDRFCARDTAAQVPMGNHLHFDPAYVDTLVATNMQPVALAEAILLRADAYDCKLTHRAIKAHGKCVYYSKGSGNRELFVVAENGGRINLVVRDEKNGQVMQDVSAEGKPSAQVVWKMPRLGTYTIEVENTSDKEISVIIVSN